MHTSQVVDNMAFIGHAKKITRAKNDSELAERLGVSKSHVSQWRRGLLRPTLRILARIKERTGEDLTAYVDLSGIRTPPHIPERTTAAPDRGRRGMETQKLFRKIDQLKSEDEAQIVPLLNAVFDKWKELRDEEGEESGSES